MLMILSLAFLGGCQASRIDTPSGFVEVETYHGDPIYRAVSAEGVKIEYRTHENPNGGTLEFWRRAVRRTLVEGKGHTLVESTAITSESGAEGELLRLTKKRSGADFSYLVALYVRGGKVHVVEAGGRKEDVAAHEDGLLSALRSL
jgi:hypothetical protein